MNRRLLLWSFPWLTLPLLGCAPTALNEPEPAQSELGDDIASSYKEVCILSANLSCGDNFAHVATLLRPRLVLANAETVLHFAHGQSRQVFLKRPYAHFKEQELVRSRFETADGVRLDKDIVNNIAVVCLETSLWILPKEVTWPTPIVIEKIKGSNGTEKVKIPGETAASNNIMVQVLGLIDTPSGVDWENLKLSKPFPVFPGKEPFYTFENYWSSMNYNTLTRNTGASNSTLYISESYVGGPVFRPGTHELLGVISSKEGLYKTFTVSHFNAPTYVADEEGKPSVNQQGERIASNRTVFTWLKEKIDCVDDPKNQAKDCCAKDLRELSVVAQPQ